MSDKEKDNFCKDCMYIGKQLGGNIYQCDLADDMLEEKGINLPIFAATYYDGTPAFCCKYKEAE